MRTGSHKFVRDNCYFYISPHWNVGLRITHSIWTTYIMQWLSSSVSCIVFESGTVSQSEMFVVSSKTIRDHISCIQLPGSKYSPRPIQCHSWWRSSNITLSPCGILKNTAPTVSGSDITVSYHSAYTTKTRIRSLFTTKNKGWYKVLRQGWRNRQNVGNL